MAMMSFGDFFKAAPHCKPVCPRPVKLTAVASGKVLPGGARNPNPNYCVKAQLEGALVLLPPQDLPEVRALAREAVLRRRAEKHRLACEAAQKADQPEPPPQPDDEAEFTIQFQAEHLQRVLREWDPEQKVVGGPLFPDAEVLRRHVMFRECNRVMELYDRYVQEEHAESVSAESFRQAAGAGEGLAPGAPRRPVAPAPLGAPAMGA